MPGKQKAIMGIVMIRKHQKRKVVEVIFFLKRKVIHLDVGPGASATTFSLSALLVAIHSGVIIEAISYI